MKTLKRPLSLLLVGILLSGILALFPACAVQTANDLAPAQDASEDELPGDSDQSPDTSDPADSSSDPGEAPEGNSDGASSALLLEEPELDSETRALYDTVVMIIGDREVTYETYRYYYLSVVHGSDFEDPSYWQNEENLESLRQLQDDILYELRYTAAVHALCEQYGISLSEEELQEIEENLEEEALQIELFYDSTLAEMLSTYYMTLDFYRDLYRFNALSEKLFYALTDPEAGIMDFSDASVQALSERFFHVKHILYGIDGFLSDEEVEAKAAATVALLRAIEDQEERSRKFDELMAEDSVDYYEGGDNFYYYTHGEMVEEFETAVDGLAENEISDPVRSDFGYHVILRLPIDLAFFKENYYSYYKFRSMIEERSNEMEVVTTDFYASLTPENAK